MTVISERLISVPVASDIHLNGNHPEVQINRDHIIATIVENSQFTEEAYDPLLVNGLFAKLDDPAVSQNKEEIDTEIGGMIARIQNTNFALLRPEERLVYHRDAAMAIKKATIIFNNSPDVPDVDDFFPGAGNALHTVAAATGLAPSVTDAVYTATIDGSGMHSRRFTNKKRIIEVAGKPQTIFMEDAFRLSVLSGFSQQDDLVHTFNEIAQTPIYGPEFAPRMRKATGYVRHMIEGMSVAGPYVEDEYFSTELLLFLKPIKVFRKEYLHSGSQMTGVLLSDTVLGTATVQDPDYARYFAKNMEYASVKNKSHVAHALGNFQGSVIDRLLAGMPAEMAGCTSDTEWGSALKETIEFLAAMYKFRKPHDSKIHAGMKFRKDKAGSGGDEGMTPILLERNKFYLDRLKGLVR